jgi:ABC-type oligopeptide transport system substrate-binding subunit
VREGGAQMRPQRRVGALLCVALLLSAAVLAEGGSGSSKGKKSSGKKNGSKKPATLEVTIPEGARSGDKLNFVTPSALPTTRS